MKESRETRVADWEKRWLLCAEIFVLNWEMIECTACTSL